MIRLRFGIGCEREHTLEEIGQEFDVTRERIRQIEAKALRQLRAPGRALRLRALMAAVNSRRHFQRDRTPRVAAMMLTNANIDGKRTEIHHGLGPRLS